MINPFTEINWKPGTNDLKKIGRNALIGFLVISIALLLVNICIFKYPISKSVHTPLIVSASGVAVWFLSYFVKPIFLPICYIWFIIAAFIEIVAINLLLSLFYYLVLTPVGLALKYLIGKDPLNLKETKTRKSNWNDHNVNKPLKRYFKQY